MNQFVQNLIDGLGARQHVRTARRRRLDAVGVMHLVNFAHGELLTIGAYVIYTMRSNDLSCGGAIPVSILAAVLLSMTIEFVAFRRVHAASAFTLLLTSFTIEILSHAAWRIGVSSTPRRYEPPDIAFKVVEIGNFNVELWDVISIVVAIICFAGTALGAPGHDVRPRDPCLIGGLRRRAA